MADKRKDREKELDRELRDHLELDAEAKMDRGLGEKEARYAAQRDFGNTTLVREVTREMWAWSFLERFLQNVRYGLRLIGRNPGFTAVAILTLALGIGANTAIFSIVNAVFLRPLPFAESERIFLVARTGNKIGGGSISWPIFLAWKERQGLFDALGTVNGNVSYTLTGHGDPEQIPTDIISYDVLPALEVRPAIGRGFQPEEAQDGGPWAIVISDALWRRKFSTDPNIIGQTISFAGAARIVEGVMPPDFQIPMPYAQDAQVWLLTQIRSSSQNPTNVVRCIGRLRRGVSVSQAETELSTPIAGLHDLYPKMIGADERAHLRTLHSYMVGAAGTAPLLLLGAAGFVLLIACANVANLFLARASSRQREIAVRSALGASRAQIIWQLLTESILVGVAGGCAGLFVCYASFNSVLALVPTNLPHLGVIRLDARVLIFSLLLGVMTGLFFGLAPALQASAVDLQSGLKEGTSGSGFGRKRGQLRSALVMSEVGMSLILLVGAALMFESLSGLLHTQPGFDPHNVLTFDVALPRASGYNAKAKAMAFYDAFTAKVSALPGVQNISYASSLPLNPNAPDYLFSVEGGGKFEGQSYDAGFRFVGENYFRSLKIPFIRGREITSADTGNSESVVLINEVMARTIWTDGSDPIGQHIWFGKPMGAGAMEPAPRRIIGIVSDVSDTSLDQKAESIMYFPYAQQSKIPNEATFIIRTSQEPRAIVPDVREIIHKLDRDLPISSMKTMDELVADSLDSHRFPTILLSLFGAMALVIAAVGVYGVISYSVAQRTHEIGVRVALGASRGRILRMVLAQGMRLAVFGIGAGLIASYWATGLLHDLLYGVTPTDPVTLFAVTLALLAVAFAACWIPARRATRVDPLVALRYE
jgi:putative ABC transport system permease protein